MFSMSIFWERFFFVATWVSQGTSFLSPRAYAVMHRLHHKHSDLSDDPHSPVVVKNFFKMMFKTYRFYLDLLHYKKNYKNLDNNIPRWDCFERFADNNFVRFLFNLGFLFVKQRIQYASASAHTYV